MAEIRLATAALSQRIFAGRPNKSRDGFRGERHDVTSDVFKVIGEKVGIGNQVVVERDGESVYRIAVLPIDSGGGRVASAIRDVAELPDRTSPDDQPDMLFVSIDELQEILERHFGDDI